MSTQSAFTTVTLRRLPQGESLQVTISGNKSQTILRDKDTEVQTPSISSTDPYTLTPAVYGTGGAKASLSNYKWYMDDIEMNGDLGFDYVIVSSDDFTGMLKLYASPIGHGSIKSIHGIVFKFTADATLNGHTYSVEKSVVINCAETSANSYWGAIEAENGTTLDDEQDSEGNYLHHSTKLDPYLYLGTSKVTPTAIKWFKTGAGDEGADLPITASEDKKWDLNSDNSLTVYRDGVDAASHFEAHFFVGGDSDSNEVEAEGVSIIDVADELQIAQIPDQTVDTNGTATFTVKAYSNKTGKQINITDESQISVVLTDSIRQRTIDNTCIEEKKVSSDGIGTIKMNEKYLHVPYAESDGIQTKHKVGDVDKLDWCICGDSAGDDTCIYADGTTYTDDTVLSAATECEVVFLIGVTIDM